MELLGALHFEAIYDPERARLFAREHVANMVTRLATLARVEAFDQWTHRHRGHSVDERRKAWLNIAERFDGDIDWSGLTSERAVRWHRITHVFSRPFSGLQYAFASVGALQLWERWQADSEVAIADLRTAWRLGGSADAPALYRVAGLRFSLDRPTLEEAMLLADAMLWPDRDDHFG